MVHLDASRRRLLGEAIAAGPSQVFVTGVDRDDLLDPARAAVHLRIDGGRLRP